MDLPPDDWNDGEMPAQDDMFLHFKNPPIPITCMHIALDFRKRIGVEFSAAHSLLHSAESHKHAS